MAIIKSILEEELERYKEMEKSYLVKIESLPNGSLRKKRVGNKEYYYLKYRDGNKIKTDYLKINNTTELETIKKNINLRKNLEKELMEIKKDCKLIRKVVKT